MRYHLTLAIIKKSTSNKCWKRCREKGTLLHCVGLQTDIATMENSVEISLKKKKNKNLGKSYHTTQQSHYWAYTLRKSELKKTRTLYVH